MQVNAPVPTYTGEVAGVAFSRGVGDVDPGDQNALAYFRRHGYTVEPEKGEPEQPASGQEPDGSVGSDGSEAQGADGEQEPETDPEPGGDSEQGESEAKPGTRRTRKAQ